MRLVSYKSSAGPRVAALVSGGAVDLHAADPRIPGCMKRFLATGEEGLALAREALNRGAVVPLDDAALLPPVPSPEKIICVGLNYADHARESNMAIPAEPVFFCKFSSAAQSPTAPVTLPPVSCQVDYEAELVVVIGRGGKNIAADDAPKHVAGYCCGNDLSARDWQLGKPGGQWLLGKSFDGFAPFGPALVTADEVPDPSNLAIELRLNGQVMQKSSTRQLIFSVPQLVAYVSQVCRLAPGDVLFTGTPPGVGFARKPPVYLQPGDKVEVEIELLGVLRTSLVAGG